jgi:hypothetical protein
MCIATKIAELEKKILKLKRLQAGTFPVKSALTALLEDIAAEAPEELPEVWQEILAIGSQYNNLAVQVQPLAVDELRQWQSANAENKKLKAELEEINRKLENSSASWSAKYPELYNPQNSSPTTGQREPKQKVQDSPPGPEHEPEECTDSIQGILGSKGFYEPDINLGGAYDPEDKQGSYDGWDIYCLVHDSGQAMRIGLSNEKLGQFWDVGTEFLADHDPNFPKSLSEKQPILAWVRSVIDLLPTPTIAETPGQQVLPLEFSDTVAEETEEVLKGDEYGAGVKEELAFDNDDFENQSAPEEKTELQKLLVGLSNYIFQKLQAKVRIDSEFIESEIESDEETEEDDPATEFVEEALFTVTDLNGENAQYYYHSAEDLTKWKPIAGWNPGGNLLEVAENYAKKWAKEQAKKSKPVNSENHKNLSNLCDAVAEPHDNNDDIQEDSEKKAPDLIKEFSITNLPLRHRGIRAEVTPAIGNGKFAGATFTFYRGTEKLFSSSETADDIARGENNPELIAVALAESWFKRQEVKNSSPANTTHTEPRPKDDFTELVYLSDAVAYLKRKDTGEVLTGYLGFSNKTAEGDRAPTMAKSRATRWQEYLVGVYQLACSGPRECQRIQSKNPKQPFKYELKIVKPSMGQLYNMANENFGLYPNEVEEKSEARHEIPSQGMVTG